MTNVQLQNAFMIRANLINAVLKRARLDGATMDRVTAIDSGFDLAILYKASWADGDLPNANFDQADIRLRDWQRTSGPNGRHAEGPHLTCCSDLNAHTAKGCGYE